MGNLKKIIRAKFGPNRANFTTQNFQKTPFRVKTVFGFFAFLFLSVYFLKRVFNHLIGYEILEA